MKNLQVNYKKFDSLKGLALTLVLVTPFMLTGCGKKAECNIDVSHAHKYVNEAGYERYLNREHLKYEGYLRYEDDNYIGGNAWIISSLWLALYDIEIKNYNRAKELFDWVTNHADNLNFLPEQIDKNGNNSAWVIQLSWSHAMYVIVKYKLMKR